MIDHIISITQHGGAVPPFGVGGPLPSRQYGPAWVADCYGTTHEERLAALNEAEWTTLPVDTPKGRDFVAAQWWRLVTNDGRDGEVGVVGWMPEPEPQPEPVVVEVDQSTGSSHVVPSSPVTW